MCRACKQGKLATGGIQVRTERAFFWALLFGLIAVAVPAFAHHGYAAYDLTKVVTLKGTITSYTLANPHSTITFDVKDPKGKLQHWSAEFGYMRQMKAAGWTAKSLQQGDEVILDVNVAKNGSYVAALRKVAFPDGRVLRMGAGGE
jgi:Family of unknown function (DUF6152)